MKPGKAAQVFCLNPIYPTGLAAVLAALLQPADE